MREAAREFIGWPDLDDQRVIAMVFSELARWLPRAQCRALRRQHLGPVQGRGSTRCWPRIPFAIFTKNSPIPHSGYSKLAYNAAMALPLHDFDIRRLSELGCREAYLGDASQARRIGRPGQSL